MEYGNKNPIQVTYNYDRINGFRRFLDGVIKKFVDP
jgi:hypothetical protein